MRVSLEFNTSSPDDRSLLSSVMKSLITLCDNRTSVETENDEQPTDADKEEETKQKEEKKNSKRRKLVKSMDQKVVVVESDGEKESSEFACAPEPCVVDSTPSDNTAPSKEKPKQETPVPAEEEDNDQENPYHADEKPKSLTPQEFREKVAKLRESLGIKTEKEGNMLARAITKMSEFMYQTNVPS